MGNLVNISYIFCTQVSECVDQYTCIHDYDCFTVIHVMHTHTCAYNAMYSAVRILLVSKCAI